MYYELFQFIWDLFIVDCTRIITTGPQGSSTDPMSKLKNSNPRYEFFSSLNFCQDTDRQADRQTEIDAYELTLHKHWWAQ